MCLQVRIKATAALMSQRKPCSDKARVKQSSASLRTDIDDDNSGGDDGLSTGGWHRRSLFSSERLDLILSNLRHHRSKSADGDQRKQLSHGVNYGRDAPHSHQQKPRCGRGKPSRYFTARRNDRYDVNYNRKVAVQCLCADN